MNKRICFTSASSNFWPNPNRFHPMLLSNQEVSLTNAIETPLNGTRLIVRPGSAFSVTGLSRMAPCIPWFKGIPLLPYRLTMGWMRLKANRFY